jgi:hypothetical protein
MNLPSLETLLAGIRAHELVSSCFYANFDCDDALDRRDSDREFGSDWVRAHRLAESRWTGADSMIQSQIDTIRKESFLVVTEATNHHEIASYVSDDFDLIGKCSVLALEDAFVIRLWQSYQSGTFPLPAIA